MTKSFCLNTSMDYNDIVKAGEVLLAPDFYSGIEIRYPYDVPHCNPGEYTKGVELLINKYDATTSMHLSYDLPHASASLAIKREALRVLKDSILYGVEMGISVFVMHTSQVPLFSYSDRPQNLQDALLHSRFETMHRDYTNKTVDVAADLATFIQGSKYYICIENTIHPHSTAVNVSELINIIKLTNVDNVKCTFDVAHSTVVGCDVASEIRLADDYLHHVHVSDNFGKCDNHLQLGLGSINFDYVFRALTGISYQGIVVVEGLYNDCRDLISSSVFMSKYI